MALLPRPRKVPQRVTRERAGEDALQCVPLPIVGVLVEIEDVAPRRTWLVVVVAHRDRDLAAPERHVLDSAVLDRPGEHAEALAERGAPAGHAVDPPARANRVAVAGFEVTARDPPAHR